MKSSDEHQKEIIYLKELDGTLMRGKYAAFRALPYITQNHEFMKNHQYNKDESNTLSLTDSDQEPENPD